MLLLAGCPVIGHLDLRPLELLRVSLLFTAIIISMAILFNTSPAVVYIFGLKNSQ